MKKITVLLFMVLLVFGCTEVRKPTLLEIEDAELATGIRNDTFFLNFYFGMTEEQVDVKFKELLQEERIYLSPERQYRYDFAFDRIPKTATATFFMDYHNGNLYKMSLTLTSDELIGSSELIFYNLIDLFQERYGICDISRESMIGGDICYWIQGNRKITILPIARDVRITYTNIIAEREVEQEKKEKEQQEREKILQDL